MALTESQQQKASTFDDMKSSESMDRLLEAYDKAVPRGKSADYYEGLGDGMEKAVELFTRTGEPDLVCKALAITAIVVAKRLRELDATPA